MKKKVRTLIQRISHDPLHAIIGSDLIITGLILLFHQRYFFWPPYPRWIIAVENDSIIGFVGVLAGLGLIWWALEGDKSFNLNRVSLAVASGYYTLLGATEFIHAALAPDASPHMFTTSLSEFVFVLIALYMSKRSPTRKEKGGNND